MRDLRTSSSLQPRRIRVLLPLPLGGVFDYLLPGGLDSVPGDFVEVPLGRRQLVAVVWDGSDEAGVEQSRLRAIIRKLDMPPIAADLRRFIDWVATYTVSAPGAVLRMTLGGGQPPAAPMLQNRLRLASNEIDVSVKLTPLRRRLIEILRDGAPMTTVELAGAASCGAAAVRAALAAGLLEEIQVSPSAELTLMAAWPALSEAQDAAAEELVSAVVAKEFKAFLIDGVTGSGKTEVYFKAIAAARDAGRQVLVLLPEIALSAQWIARFTAQFGGPPGVWHSEIGDATRKRLWYGVASGEIGVVVGARSALFLPFKDLGLIVVDEEHDQSFKQEEGVIYHARDMAIVRASQRDIPIVLASATPSLESLQNVERGRYRRLVLPARHGGASLPTVIPIDLRVDRPARQKFLSPRLVDAMQDVLAAGEQAMLFLNRRGYAPLTLCRTCGHRLQCPNCTAWLVEHRNRRRLLCHHCGYHLALPEKCPSCDDTNSFAPCGPGVERLAEEVAELFPEARVAIMASDSLAGPEAAAKLIEAVQAREVDLLIGTQMMAKGHHFPMLTLVGVVDADLGLSGGDLRAAERTFQLLHQVSGRAGRGDRPGLVMLQTADPTHPVIKALVANDRDDLLAVEAEGRRAMRMPPFGRLAALIVSGEDPQALDLATTALARSAPHLTGVDILGPAPAPLALLRRRHRARFLVKAPRDVRIQDILRDWIASVTVPRSIKIQIDIDPYSFL